MIIQMGKFKPTEEIKEKRRKKGQLVENYILYMQQREKEKFH